MRVLCLVLTLLGLCTGCGPGVSTIGGTVKCNGKPLPKGVISFTADNSEATSVSIEIVEGRYELETVPGKYQVQISAPVVVRQQKESNATGAPMIDITEESLPDKYHAASTLTFEAQPGSNTKDWDVESKHPKQVK